MIKLYSEDPGAKENLGQYNLNRNERSFDPAFMAGSFRLKDGGKEFSEDNLNYVLMQQQEFAKSSPDSWGNFYSSRRSFTPYYDWNKEVTDKMKDFKPDETSVTTPKGFYFYKNKDASVEPDAVKRYEDVYNAACKETAECVGTLIDNGGYNLR